jgi:hypothetical protein
MVVKSVKNSFIVAMAIFNNEGYIASNYDMANHCGSYINLHQQSLGIIISFKKA